MSPNPPREPPAALRAELAASIDHTLHEEARRNELAIASVRLATLGAMAVVELWLVSGPSALGWAAPWCAAFTFAYLALAAAIAAALRRGWWTRWLWVALPIADATYMAARIGVIFVVAGIPHVVRVQELATVTAMASLLAASGSFRLQPRAVGLTTALGAAQYVGFAAWIGLPSFHAVVHLSLIGAVGFMAGHLTRIVRRAVHSEVTRLTLRRLLPAAVIDAADSDPMALLTEPRSLDATVVVTDLRGFTTWAENRTPLEVLGFLNAVQGALAKAVSDHGGTVDKFMGDGMLAVFGAPQPLADHADRALAAVRAMLDAAGRFEPLALGVGVHSGEVVVGCVGAGIRMEFTVLGDTVNTASRLESATKDHDVAVLVSRTTRDRCAVELRPIGELEIRGRVERLVAYTFAP
ncbi:MAG: adenylate/guanylate cyclase domain-containing protein [Myxococcota bacterium]